MKIECNQAHWPNDRGEATHFYKNLHLGAPQFGNHIFSTSNYIARCEAHSLSTNDKLIQAALEIDKDTFIVESVMES
jgi:hypothetical protein